ncbi:MAG: hypothetical protein RLZZ335_702 [Bacteroidota bacterium]|jgi:hypothetical protein
MAQFFNLLMTLMELMEAPWNSWNHHATYGIIMELMEPP